MARPSGPARKRTNFNSIEFPEGVTIEGVLRPKEDRQDREHRRWRDVRSFWIKEVSVHIVVLMILAITAIYCFWVLWQSNFAKDDRQWAMSTLTTILVGIVGYLFGKATK